MNYIECFVNSLEKYFGSVFYCTHIKQWLVCQTKPSKILIKDDCIKLLFITWRLSKWTWNSVKSYAYHWLHFKRIPKVIATSYDPWNPIISVVRLIITISNSCLQLQNISYSI